MKLFTIAVAVSLLPAALHAQTPAVIATDSVPTLYTPQSAQTKTLSLSREQCISIALQDNPTIRVADMEIQRVDYSKKETRAALFPEINFQGAYQRSIELQTISMNMGGQTQSFKMGSDNSWNFAFGVQLPLVAPTLWKSIRMGSTQIDAMIESARASRLDMTNQVNQAYYALLLAKASYDVVRSNYDIARLNAETYAKRFEQGTASEYDVLRSSVQVKTVEPQLLQAEIGVRQSELALKVLMGISADVHIVPTVSLREMQREMFGYTSALLPSIENNTSLRSLDIQRRLAKDNVDLKKLAWVPTLGASFNLAWSALSNGNAVKNQHFHPYSNVGLALSVPIFSGGSKYYGLKQARIAYKELELQRDNLVNSLRMQVELAIDNINKEIDQIATSEEGMRQAAKAYDIMQKSFEVGAATYLDLRDSELANTTAQLAYFQSVYNYLASTSELDLLLGRDEAIPADAREKK